MKRIQRRRTRGWRKPDNCVYVGRGTKWGNPYTVQPIGMARWIVYEWDEPVSDMFRRRPDALAQCLVYYRLYAELQLRLEPGWLDPLRGKDLCCWCKLEDACHADVLIELMAEDGE